MEVLGLVQEVSYFLSPRSLAPLLLAQVLDPFRLFLRHLSVVLFRSLLQKRSSKFYSFFLADFGNLQIQSALKFQELGLLVLDLSVKVFELLERLFELLLLRITVASQLTYGVRHLLYLLQPKYLKIYAVGFGHGLVEVAVSFAELVCGILWLGLDRYAFRLSLDQTDNR